MAWKAKTLRLHKREPKTRGNAGERGYGRQWRKAREKYLGENPLCVMHLAQGEIVAASVVDHVVPHRGDNEKFWDVGNWQSLCKRCHDAKTARGE